MSREPIMIDDVDVAECVYRAEEKCILKDDGCYFFPNCYYKQLKRKEQECEKLKAEIKLSKEMLIQNTSETNKYTLPQIIEEFISDNYIDQQNEDGYTIPVFIQIENILEIKEELEQQLDQLKAENEHLAEKEEEAKHYLEEANKYKQAFSSFKKYLQ